MMVQLAKSQIYGYINTHQGSYAAEFGHCSSVATLGGDATVQLAWCVAHAYTLALSDARQSSSLGWSPNGQTCPAQDRGSQLRNDIVHELLTFGDRDGLERGGLLARSSHSFPFSFPGYLAISAIFPPESLSSMTQQHDRIAQFQQLMTYNCLYKT